MVQPELGRVILSPRPLLSVHGCATISGFPEHIQCSSRVHVEGPPGQGPYFHYLQHFSRTVPWRQRTQSCDILARVLFTQQGPDGELGDGYDEGVRHAETPELAREALADCAALIFKGQVEVAFREQTAGHNALLLFVHLALSMMEERLMNAFKELHAKQAEVCCCTLRCFEYLRSPFHLVAM